MRTQKTEMLISHRRKLRDAKMPRRFTDAETWLTDMTTSLEATIRIRLEHSNPCVSVGLLYGHGTYNMTAAKIAYAVKETTAFSGLTKELQRLNVAGVFIVNAERCTVALKVRLDQPYTGLPVWIDQ